jgi:hypothetical protein
VDGIVESRGEIANWFGIVRMGACVRVAGNQRHSASAMATMRRRHDAPEHGNKTADKEKGGERLDQSLLTLGNLGKLERVEDAQNAVEEDVVPAVTVAGAR